MPRETGARDPGERDGGDGQERLRLALRALDEVAGAALILDDRLDVRGATPAAEALLDGPVPDGISAPKILCGGAVERPIAEALSEGRAVTGVIARPAPGGDRYLRVRATPLRAGARAASARDGHTGARSEGQRPSRGGWVLLLDEEVVADADDAPVQFQGMWTRSPAMKRVFLVLEKAARGDASILVRGETGTGKELVAAAVHALSPRSRGPFRAINCAALPPSLLESELFGHVRGAFTGAVRDNPGFFRAAAGGTLFLDEVAEMPLELQAKLLRVLETKTVIPVGGRDPVSVDVRVVAATHTGLRKAVEEGRFRADLMYRLRVVPIFLPALRERRGDVMLLTQKMIEELNGRGGREVARVAPGARAILEAYAWPGNVRELRNVLEYAYVIGEGPVLVPSDLPPELSDPDAAGDSAANVVVNVPPPVGEQDPPEVAKIRRALERAGGSRERAARMLGMSRVTLWRRMKQLGIEEG
jgi:DNA-binding NtrC family response regulator